MSWIAFTAADVAKRLNSTEVAAMRPLGNDPLPDIVTQVIREVRSRVRAFQTNKLGAEGTIPDELLLAAINRARYELITVLPVATLMTEDRRQTNKDALAALDRVADGRMLIEQPASADVSAENVPTRAGGAQVVRSSTHEQFTRGNMRRL